MPIKRKRVDAVAVRSVLDNLDQQYARMQTPAHAAAVEEIRAMSAADATKALKAMRRKQTG